MSNVDGNGNRIVVSPIKGKCQGRPMVVCQIVGTKFGYVSLVEEEPGGFGDEFTPGSYNRPCMGWYGAGETYANLTELVSAIADTN